MKVTHQALSHLDLQWIASIQFGAFLTHPWRDDPGWVTLFTETLS